MPKPIEPGCLAMTYGFTGVEASANGYTVNVVRRADPMITSYLRSGDSWIIHSAMGMPCWEVSTNRLITGHDVAMGADHLRRLDDPDVGEEITTTEDKEIYEKA